MTRADPQLLAAVAQAAAQDAGGLDPALLGAFLEYLLEAAHTGRPLPRAARVACEASGRLAAQQGVAARALVDLYLSAAWRLWRDAPQMTDGDADRVRSAGLGVLHAADDTVAAVLGGFQRARTEMIRLQEGVRQQVADALLEGGNQAVAAVATAAGIGLSLTGPVAVLLARGHAFGEAGPAVGALPTRVERAMAGRYADAHPLVLLRDQMLLCIFAAPDRQAVLGAGDAVAAVLREVLGPGRPEPGAAPAWRATVSRPRPGATAVRTSFEEARDNLAIAERLRSMDEIVDAHDLAVHRMLLRDRAAARDLVDSTLSGLLTARGGPVPLLATLAAYFETGGNTTATATRLHLSVRAVSYRLDRIADLIGRDPTDPAERLTLQNAVAAALVLGWPTASADV